MFIPALPISQPETDLHTPDTPDKPAFEILSTNILMREQNLIWQDVSVNTHRMPHDKAAPFHSHLMLNNTDATNQLPLSRSADIFILSRNMAEHSVAETFSNHLQNGANFYLTLVNDDLQYSVDIHSKGFYI